MGFKNLTTYFFTCCKFNTVWQIVPQRANWCSEGYLSVYCCVAFWYRRTWMGIKIDAFPMVYTFGSDRLQTVVLMNETGSCTAIRNVQKVKVARKYVVICSFLRVRVLWRHQREGNIMWQCIIIVQSKRYVALDESLTYLIICVFIKYFLNFLFNNNKTYICNSPSSPFLEYYPIYALNFSQTWNNLYSWILP